MTGKFQKQHFSIRQIEIYDWRGEAQLVVTMSYCFANYEEAKQVTSGKQTIPEDYTFVPQAIPVVQMKKNLWPVCIARFTMNSMKPEKVSLS